MKKNTLVVIALLIGIALHAQDNALTAKEKKQGWKLLFDGKTLNGWHNFNSDKIGEAWEVVDGAIHLSRKQQEGFQVKGGGDIVTSGEFENYELSIEWKIAPCGNSGIIFNVTESPAYEYVWQTGPEMQVLDNACHPDAKIEKHRAGNLYDLIKSPTESVKPANEWNLARIKLNKGRLQLWLNGVIQVETKMFTPAWDALIKGSKFKDMAGFGKAKKGHISLQDHGDLVWFKNIKIKELKSTAK
jgi:cytochrome c